ncbi:chloride channel CLIC-like protein 1 isoform X2 [Lampris incognitus]|nr:chloride channel CLIC-like protein 1 isoform X2 [Lampris incognitus]XP_056132387.1 chloride channel CLIC-like protein 1 isoform X2 [Lampris incognitus]
MLNYDASAKTMKKPVETVNYPSVPTKRREHNQGPDQADLLVCNKNVAKLQSENEEQRKQISLSLQQSACVPVFKRFFTRLLKDIEKVGLPSDVNEIVCDAKVSLSKQAAVEIKKLLSGEQSCSNGALDDAVSQVLVDLRPHNYEAWRWRFEDNFGVDLDTVLKVCLCVMIIVTIICTQLWSVVSWFIQFKRLFAICFFMSIIWNWFYLYKIAFAEHQNNLVKMDSVNAKCTGVKKIDWSDSLKEWFRSTLTLQDDPCKRYYEVLMVNPILLVPPTKAISVTITTFITEPLKHVGQGISEFIRALLKDLPVTLQIPVFITIILAVLIFMYGSVHAAFQYGITAPFRGHRRQPPPALDQPQPRPLRQRDAGRNRLAGGDTLQPVTRPRAIHGRSDHKVHQQKPDRKSEKSCVFVETLRSANQLSSEDEPDVVLREEDADEEQQERLSNSDSEAEGGDSDDQEEVLEELKSASSCSVAEAKAKAPVAKAKPTAVDQSSRNANPTQANQSKDSETPKSLLANRQAERPAGGQPPQTTTAKGSQVLERPDKESTHRQSMDHIETIGVPVQETAPQ